MAPRRKTPPAARRNAGFAVVLAPPRNGWLPLELKGPTSAFKRVVSHTPFDSLGQLVGALCGLLESGRPGLVRFHDEPEQYHFSFEPGPASAAAQLLVLHYPRGKRLLGAGVELFRHEATAVELARVFWRALRKLQTAFPAAGSPHWVHPFPAHDVDALGKLLSKR